MADIRKDDVIDPLLQKAIKELTSDTKKYLDVLNEIAIKGRETKGDKTFGEIAENAKRAVGESQILESTIKKLEKAVERLSVIFTEDNKILKQATILEKQLNAALEESITHKKENAKAAKAASDQEKYWNQRRKESVQAMTEQNKVLKDMSAYYRDLEQKSTAAGKAQQKINEQQNKYWEQRRKESVQAMTASNPELKSMASYYAGLEKQSDKQIAIDAKEAARSKQLLIAAQNTQRGSVQQLQAVNAILADRMKKLNVLTEDGAKKYQQLDAAMKRNQGRMQVIRDSEKEIIVWKNLAKSIASYAAAYFSVQSAMNVVNSFIKNTRTFDQLDFSYRTIIKDASELAETQKFLSKITVNYGLDLANVSERYLRFRAATQQSNMTAAETQKIFNSVSKAAATLGLKTDEVAGVYLALEQMVSKGKITTEELRRQLGERLSGAFGIFASALGVSTSELDKMLKKGSVISAEVLPKFADQLEKAYGIESVNRVDNLNAAIGRLNSTWQTWVKSGNGADFLTNKTNAINSLLTAVLNVDLGLKSLISSFRNLSQSDVERLFDVYRNTPSSSKDVKNFQVLFGEMDRRSIQYVVDNRKNMVDNLVTTADFSRKEAELLVSHYIKMRNDKANEDRITSNLNKISNSKNLENLKVLEKRYIQATVDELAKGNEKKADEFRRYVSAIEHQLEALAQKKTTNTKGKGNQYTSLEQLQDINKQELEDAKQTQTELLADFEGTEIAKIELARKYSIMLLELRQAQIEDEKKLATKEQQGALNVESAKLETQKSTVNSKAKTSTSDQLLKETIADLDAYHNERVNQSQALVEITRIGIDDQMGLLQDASLDQIKLAKNNKERIMEIEHELTIAMLNEEKTRWENAIKSGTLIGSDKEQAERRILAIKRAIRREDFEYEKATDEEKKAYKREVMMGIGDIVNSGFEFSKQIYDAQAQRAQAAYDAEMKAAGDSVEGQIIAKRKFEEEDKKIRRRQAILDKTQAIFNAGLNLALAISAPDNPVLKALKITAASIGLAMAVSKPIPEYFMGTDYLTDETFSAGEKGAELIVKPSGETFLTPSKKTIFSDKSFIGSKILPHDKTQEMLSNYAITEGAKIFTDMSKTNTILTSMDKKLNGKDERFLDAKGNLIVKHNNITTRYASGSI